MSLHRELAQAFKGGQPLRSGVIGGPGRAGSIRAAEDLRATPGFGWRRIDFALVLNGAGDVVGVERPPWRPSGKQKSHSMPVPHRQVRTQGGFSGFLWGSSLHALGLRRWDQPGESRSERRYFNCFRTFHSAALADSRDPSLRAFTAFLKNWRPEQALDIPELSSVAGGSLVFRFQYDEYFLHESHAARLIWSRVLNSPGAIEEPDEAA